ncbi:MAG: HAMP domain-containing sensor histidine kinase, partial [Ferruginibacter sp.]
MEPAIPINANSLQENFEDFFEQALSGFIIADAKGIIIRANKKIAGWINCSTDDLKNKKFSDLLSIGGIIYYETHLGPLLHMQGFFDEVVLEISCIDRPKFKVMVNAMERKDENGKLCFIRYTILKASDRLQYEQNLQLAKTIAEKEIARQAEMVTLREQLIAVLGHDLRNPLAAVTMAADMLSNSAGEENSFLISTLKRSTFRMAELINNIMDFARTRLGQGIILKRKDIELEPLLQHVLEEMKLIYPKRDIKFIYEVPIPINCDPD